MKEILNAYNTGNYISANIESISMNGVVKVRFSEQINVPKNISNYNDDLTLYIKG